MLLHVLKATLMFAATSLFTPMATAQETFAVTGNSGTSLEIEILAEFDTPWAMSFLPDGQALVTEKTGALWLVSSEGSPLGEIQGTPVVQADGQGGFGDVVAHPDYANNKLVYLSWVERDESGSGAVVARAPLQITGNGGSLGPLQRVWEQAPRMPSSRHYSHRLAFDRDAHLYVTSGDRGRQTPAQDLSNNLGTIVRLDDDGTPAADNPFIAQGGAAAEFWTVGHRNPLGIAFASDGVLWAHEMGPKGGDELNRIERGANYGWPVVSNGMNYSGSPIPDHETSDDFMSPALSWVPSVSPSGLVVHTGTLFDAWQGQALMGALSGRALLRVALDGSTAAELERFQWGARVREVEEAPDGSLWILEDSPSGRLLRLTPGG